MATSKLQAHFFKLLCELDDLCAEHGISYSLAEHSAWDAVKFHEYHGGMYDTCIMMTKDALSRLEQVVGERSLANRRLVVDGAGSRTGATVRYIDDQTTLYDFKNPRRFSHPAVGVDIRVLTDGGSGCYVTVNPRGERLELPKSLFESYVRADIAGRGLSLVADYDSYFTLLVSKDWRTRTYGLPVAKEPATPFNLIYADDLPFEKLAKRPVMRKATSPWMMTHLALYNWWRSKRCDGATGAFEKRYKKYLNLTEDRFIIWEELYPAKDEIMRLAEENPVGEDLASRLSGYLAAVDKHKKAGLGLFIDEDILRASLPLMEAQKGRGYVDDYLRSIPEAHRREGIEEMLRRKGVNHPLLKS